MSLPTLKIVKEDSLHEEICNYMKNNNSVVPNIDEMKEVVCLMIKSGYMFVMDRDRLRDAIEDFTYICQPNDEVNKDRILKSLEYDDEDDMDDDSDVDFPISAKQLKEEEPTRVPEEECCGHPESCDRPCDKRD